MKQLISYAQSLEDVILYHALLIEKEIFYVDCGANDATNLSVTKMLYDDGIGHGINIDPLPACIESYSNRTRDINICAAVGKEGGTFGTFYYDHDTSTVASFIDDRKQLKGREKKETSVPILALGDILKEHFHEPFSGGFLKIDVEGFEYDALAGADFAFWRPSVLVIEAKPFNSAERWEKLLGGYKPVLYYGANRFYADENKPDVINRFLPIEELTKLYDILIPYNRLAAIEKMYQESTSWKLTRPIRELKKILGKK